MNKNKRIVSTICSILIWGSGQFFVCKQRLKGMILFLLQLIFVGTEIFSGYLLEALSGQITHFSFRLHGGFFTKGIWGLITLGEKEGGKNGDQQ